MRMALRVYSSLSVVLTLACQAPAAAPPVTSPVGLSGGPAVEGVSVVVVDEATGAEMAGATVTCGTAVPVAATVGASVLCNAASLGAEGIVVRAPGHVTERWVGVTRAHAVIAMTPRVDAERTLHGEITGATDRASVGVSSRFGILRSGDVTRGAVGCADASDCTVALSASLAVAHDLAIVDHGAMRLVLVRDVPTEADGSFAIDVLAQTESEPLIDLDVTLPDAVDLAMVVGVPGLSTGNGVALLGDLAEGTSTRAPAREGSLAGDGLWFVARAQTADGTGESFALDREVPVGSAEVVLPAAFLAVPTAERTGDVVTITTDAGPSLCVIESSDAAGVVERAVVFTHEATLDVPVTGTSLRVRVLDADASGDVDLDRVATGVTRFADRSL